LNWAECSKSCLRVSSTVSSQLRNQKELQHFVLTTLYSMQCPFNFKVLYQASLP